MATAPKRKGGAVVVWQEQMAAAAKAQASKEQVTGSFKSVNTRGGILSVDDTPIKNNELRCIVLASAFENQHYTGPFNPNELTVPACFALSLDGEGMAPHENSQEPACESCDACEMNVMGSADTGRGKACKNIRRLLLVTEDALESPEAMAEAEARMLKVPVTSVKNWSKYVNKLAEDVERPSWGVVTLVSVVPDAKTQFKVLFSMEELIEFDQATYDAMQNKIADLEKEIVAPYAVPTEEQPAAKPQRGGRSAVKPQRGAPPAKKVVGGRKKF